MDGGRDTDQLDMLDRGRETEQLGWMEVEAQIS